MTTLGPPAWRIWWSSEQWTMVVCATALILLPPLLVAVPLAFKVGCREAPVPFRQSSSGRLGRRFQIAKFQINFFRNAPLWRDLGILICTLRVLLGRAWIT